MSFQDLENAHSLIAALLVLVACDRLDLAHQWTETLTAQAAEIIARQPEPDLAPGTVRMIKPTASHKESAQVAQVFGTRR